MRTKKQKEIIDSFVNEMGVTPHVCNSIVELAESYDDIRTRISSNEILTKKQKNDLTIASKFAQAIIQKRINKKGER